MRTRGSRASSRNRVAELLPAGLRPGPLGRLQKERLWQGAGAVGPRGIPWREADHLLRGELQLRVVRKVETWQNIPPSFLVWFLRKWRVRVVGGGRGGGGGGSSFLVGWNRSPSVHSPQDMESHS